MRLSELPGHRQCPLASTIAAKMKPRSTSLLARENRDEAEGVGDGST